MRILLVTEDLPMRQAGGLAKHAVTLGNALIEAGHHVDLMGRSDRSYADSAPEIGFKGNFISGFDLSRSNWKEHRLGFFIPMKRPALAGRICAAINACASRYDAVHYHGHLPMVGSAVDPAVNFVQTRHDQGSECVTHLRFKLGAVCDDIDPRSCASCIHPSPGTVRTAISAAAVRRYREETEKCFATRKVIFVSDFLRRQFQRAVPGARLSSASVIHNFIDLRRLRTAAGEARSPISDVLVAGRIDVGKGIGEFLAHVPALFPRGIRVSVVGDGPYRARYEADFASPQVSFLGWRPYPDVVQRTRSARVCVVPSTCEEACSTTVLEALALGRPCVALARGGTPELLRYQRFEGQLRLVASMRELATTAIDLAEEASGMEDIPSQFEADVHVAAQKIVEVYSQ